MIKEPTPPPKRDPVDAAYARYLMLRAIKKAKATSSTAPPPKLTR